MSDRDTDDTDALLNADPNGGLDMFLGLSLTELAEKHKKILSKSPEEEEEDDKELKKKQATMSTTSTDKDQDIGDKDTSSSVGTLDCTLNNLESDERSDFLNSQGELVLSGLSEFSDSESQGTRTSNVENDDEDDDDGSECSFTYEDTTQGKKDVEDNVDNKIVEVPGIPEKPEAPETIPSQEDSSKAVEVYRENEESFVGNNSFNNNMDLKSCTGFGMAVMNGTSGCHHSIFQGYSIRHSGPSIPQGFTFGQAVNINLLRPSTGWNIPMPRFPNGAEPMFTRAPNFRTPGGYVPPKNPKPCRDLTEEQIREEMKKMYAFPDAKDENVDEPIITENKTPPVTEHNNTDNKPGKKKLKKVLRFSEVTEEIKTKDGQNVKTNLVRDSPTRTNSGESSNGKALKRKQVVPTTVHDGSGDCTAATAPATQLPGHLQDSNGLVNIQNQTSNTPLKSPVPYSTKVIRGKRSSKKKTPRKFSFGYGGESDISPIKGESLGGCKIDSPAPVPKYEQSSRPPFSPSSTSSSASAIPGSISLDDLKLVWREIETRRQLLEDQQSNDKESGIEDLGNVSASEVDNPLNVQKPVANAAAEDVKTNGETKVNDYFENFKNHSNSVPTTCYQPAPAPVVDEPESSAYSVNHMDQNRVLPMLESFAADLENILYEADIRPEEFQGIIEELGDDDDVAGGMAGLLEGLGIEGDTNNPEPILVETDEISDWAKSGASEYVKKFHDEQFKRQECEAEIRTLQRDMLELRQRNAVLEGNMVKKDATLRKITAAWNHVAKEWKAHEATSKTALSQLQKEQKELLSACQQDKERILEYEKQLMKTVELAETFKSKVAEVEESKATSLACVDEQIKKQAATIDVLTKNVEDLCNEKNAALRALRESQLQIDELSQQLKDLQTEVTSLRAKGQEESVLLAAVCKDKEELEARVATLSQENREYVCKIDHLQDKVISVETSKELLKQTLESNAAQKVKEESERLHEYYNKKVQEVIKSASEKALKAETTLVDSMKKANLETERKLSECRERHEAELAKLKSIYESELTLLKQENLQKQLLISTTAQQLQTGELARTGAVNRLQSIVSSIPSAPVFPTRPTMSDYKKASQQVQFSKFSENLNSPSLSQIGAGMYSAQQDTTNRSSGSREKTFQDASAEIIHRYTKTSTPIKQSLEEIDHISCESDNSATKDFDIVAKASRLCQYFEMTNAKVAPSSDTVDCSDKSLNEFIKVSLSDNKSKKLKSHEILPERLKKGSVRKVEGTTEAPKLKVELQKCLEEVLQSYVQQLDLKEVKTQSSDITVVPEPISTFNADDNTQCTDNNTTEDQFADASVTVSKNDSSTHCDTKEQKSRDSNNRSVCPTSDTCSSSSISLNQSQRKSKGSKHPWK